MKLKLLIVLFCLVIGNIYCQVVTIPALPSTDDNITVIYDASKGNGALKGFSGTVYMHTGVITTASTNNSDWKYVVGNWGTADTNVAMKSLGNNLYSKKYNIRKFYGIPNGITVLKLAFVFRNTDGTIVGRASDGSDILIDANAVKFGNYVSHSFTNNKLTVVAGTGTMTIEPYADKTAKIALYPDGNVVPDTTYSVIAKPSSNPATLSVNTGYLELDCGKMIVHIDKNPVRLSFIKNGITVFREETGYFSTAAATGLRFKIGTGESIYGTGSRATPINKRGQQLYSYNEAHYSYTNGQSTLNINIPFVMSTALYGLYIENRTAGTFDIGSTSDSLFQYSITNGKLAYYVMTGDNFDDILNSYTNLTGKQPIPPRWALGYLQSRFGYHTQTEAQNTVDSIQRQGFPIDGIILDVYWFGQLSDMGNLTWNNGSFQNPVQMISDFKKKGVNTVLISEPYITQSSANYGYCDSKLLFGTDNSGNYTYIVTDFFAGQAGLLDIFKPATKDWIWSKYKAHTDEGVSGWWCDVEEPEDHPSGMRHVNGMAPDVHNVYALDWAGLIYDKYRQVYPGQRVFDLMRSGFAGMQRYSTFPWSGDVSRSFDGFVAQVPIMLGMGMSGAGYMHSDLGGFAGGSYNPELYTRWLQFGAFSPVMRPHGQESVAPEPIYYPTINKTIVRNYVKLRYQLMPYNYTLAWQNSTTGRPLTMSLNYFEPSNSSLSNINDEYLWGQNMLIAPVMSSGQTNRNVIFPSGKWINYWTNQVYNGNTTSNINAPLDQMPVFVRAGSFLPMVPVYYCTANYNTDSLIVKYYPDASNPSTSFTMYDDDGQTPDANLTGDYQLITFTGDVLAHETDIHLALSGNGYSGAPSSRTMIFQVQKEAKRPYEVLINGNQTTDFISYQSYLSSQTGSYFDSINQIIYVKYNWTGSNDVIVIKNDNIGVGINNISDSFYLQYPYPNPFSSSVTINYNITKYGSYSLKFYNAEGKLIYDLRFTNLDLGSYSYEWNAEKLATGLYFICLENEKGKQWMKVVKE